MAQRRPRPSKLDPYLDKVGTVPDREVAELAGVTAENVRAFRKRRGIPAGWRGEGQQGDKPKVARKATASKPRQRRKSKLDPFMDKVGVLPDRDVAELAGVSAENVRAFRKRRGIAAGWRAEGSAAAPVIPAAEPVAAPAPAERPVRARRSKLSPYREQIGILSDSQIAKMADTAAQNVRAYRLRHGIPARWRGEGEPLPNEAAILALHAGPPAAEAAPVPAPAKAEPAPAAVVPAPAPPAQAPPVGLEGFQITVRTEVEELSFVVLANDIVDAAEKAVQGVARRGVEGRLLCVRYLARALGA